MMTDELVELELAGENRSIRRKPARVLRYPPQIPHGLSLIRTLADAVGNRQLTA
jgi:hypothetical protein